MTARPLTPAQMRAAAVVARENGVSIRVEQDPEGRWVYHFEPERHEPREDVELRDFSR